VELNDVGFESEAGVGVFKTVTAKDAMMKRATADTTTATGLPVTFALGREV
jgi:hypothetical protein